MSQRTNVVVLGAGYAGLMAAMRLAKKTDPSVSITLVNASDGFHERVRNHQLAAGQPIHPRSVTALLRGTRIRFLRGTATELDPSQRQVTVHGGKVRGAALEPVRGRVDVARFVIGVTARFMPPGGQVAVADVNGKPTLLIRRADGTPAIVVSIEVDGGQIHNVWAVANPDKLSRFEHA